MIIVEQGYTSDTRFNRARIAWDDKVVSASATGSAAGYPPESALTWQTFERWKPDDDGDTLTVTFPETEIEAICFGAHTLSVCDLIIIEVEVNGVWEEIFTTGLSPPDWTLVADFTSDIYVFREAADDESTMLLITPRLATGIRVTVFYQGAAPTIGKFFAGPLLTMLRPFYQGHSPAKLSRDDVVLPSESESGEWLGRSVIRKGRSANMSWNNLPAPWYRENFDPLAEHLVSNPCFIAWNALRFPEDTFMASTSDSITPTNSGPRDKMSVSVNFKMYRP